MGFHRANGNLVNVDETSGNEMLIDGDVQVCTSSVQMLVLTDEDRNVVTASP